MDERDVYKLTKSDKTFLVLVSLMLLGKAVWTYTEVDHLIVQNWTGAWPALILATFFGFIAVNYPSLSPSESC